MPKPFVVVELDRPRKLRYGLNQLVMLEERLNTPLSDLEGLKMGVKELRLLLWAGLVWEDSNLTPEKVGELVDESDADLTTLSEKVGEALNVSFGRAKNPAGPVVSGTGT